MTAEVLIIIIIFIFVAIAWFFISKKDRKFRRDLIKREEYTKLDLIKREEDAKRKMYEIAILKELGDRMGYSLNIQNVVEVITGSLRQFIDYSSVFYMLFLPEKVIFKVHLEKSLSRKFIDEVKAKMISSASALLNADFKNLKIEETFSGAALNNGLGQPVGSFFNIPLVVAGKFVGLLTVADTKANFYKEEEMTILYKIAQQATQAVAKLQEVVESEQSKLNAMVASMTEGVVMIDLDYKIYVVNPAAKKAVGLENKNDLSVSDFIKELGGKFDFKSNIEKNVKADKVFISDEVSLPSGFFQILVSPVKNNEKILGCVAIFRDITHEKEIERIKEDFTSMIVHELRSPLDSIKKMVELMRVSRVKKAKQEECFQMIYSSSSDMLELITNLLDIAKIEAGKFELLKQQSDIKEIIKSRVLFFAIAAKDAKIKIISCFSKDMPDKVEFDPHTISQVLNNLISNALKFNKENGSVIVQALFHKKGRSIEKEAKDSGINWFIKKDIENLPDSLLVAVTDSGVGIAPDQINKLFNKFVQAKSVFVEKGGTGLGLAITKSIIDSHGGVVGAESVEGKGSTFYFTIPINESAKVIKSAPIKTKVERV